MHDIKACLSEGEGGGESPFVALLNSKGWIARAGDTLSLRQGKPGDTQIPVIRRVPPKLGAELWYPHGLDIRCLVQRGPSSPILLPPMALPMHQVSGCSRQAKHL